MATESAIKNSQDSQVRTKILINVCTDEDHLALIEFLIAEFLRQYEYEIIYFDCERTADILIFDIDTWESLLDRNKDIIKTEGAKIIFVFDQQSEIHRIDGKIIYTPNLLDELSHFSTEPPSN